MNTGPRSPSPARSSRLRRVVRRLRHGGSFPGTQRETGPSKRGAIPFHSPTTDRKGDGLYEPSAEPGLLRILPPWVFGSNDTRLKDWAELLGVVRLRERISCLDLACSRLTSSLRGVVDRTSRYGNSLILACGCDSFGHNDRGVGASVSYAA